MPRFFAALGLLSGILAWVCWVAFFIFRHQVSYSVCLTLPAVVFTLCTHAFAGDIRREIQDRLPR